MSDWKTLSSKTVYETPWLRVQEDHVLNHVGKELTYGLVQTKKTPVYIVAVNTSGKILMFRNYRYSLGEAVWEFPAGFADDTDFLSAAKRELREEAGCESASWISLGTQYAASGIGKIPFVLFLARDVITSSMPSEENEQITERSFFSIADIEKLAVKGEITEPFILSALYLAKLHGVTHTDSHGAFEFH